MEKSKNYVVFGVLALVVSLVAVSLAYAGFTATMVLLQALLHNQQLVVKH